MGKRVSYFFRSSKASMVVNQIRSALRQEMQMASGEPKGFIMQFTPKKVDVGLQMSNWNWCGFVVFAAAIFFILILFLGSDHPKMPAPFFNP